MGAGQVDWFVGLPLALGGIAATAAGVAFASRLPERRARFGILRTLVDYGGAIGAAGVNQPEGIRKAADRGGRAPSLKLMGRA
jgi:uncharacterized membrane protein YfcA